MLCRGDGMVDMLGLEPSAVRCAGSSPVPGKLLLLAIGQRSEQKSGFN